MVAIMTALLSLSFSADYMPSSSADSLQVRAEAAFQEGTKLNDEAPAQARQAFARSAQLYEELRQSGVESAALYYNQGNAFFLSDNLPAAILAYCRGLRLAPNDPDLQANLTHAREQVVYPPPATLGRPAIDHRPPWLPRWPWLMLKLAFMAYSLGWLFWVRWRMVRQGWYLTAGTLAMLAALLLAIDPLLQEAKARHEAEQPLVVIAEDGVQLRKGDGQSFPPRYQTHLNRGVEARLLFGSESGWLQIELAGGEVGWVPRSECLVDE